MEKSPEAFRTIREVADAMDLPQHVLRFWETRFPQIRPVKRAGGRRYYRPDDIERLRTIKRLLYDEGYTIKGVQKLFKEQGGQAPAAAAAEARLPFETADAAAPERRKDLSRAPAPSAIESGAPHAAGARPEPSIPAAPGLSADELALLREILAEIHEAERILVQTRSDRA